MTPRRSKRIKVAQEAAAASKPKGAKVAPKFGKGRAGTKGKSATKVNNHSAARGSKNNGKVSKKSAQTAESSSRGALKDLLEMPLDIICEVCPNGGSRYHVGFSYLIVYP